MMLRIPSLIASPSPPPLGSPARLSLANSLLSASPAVRDCAPQGTVSVQTRHDVLLTLCERKLQADYGSRQTGGSMQAPL